MGLRNVDLCLLGGITGAERALGRLVNEALRTKARIFELSCAPCGSLPSLSRLLGSPPGRSTRLCRVACTAVDPLWGEPVTRTRIRGRDRVIIQG